jgi:hypothetical protein
VASTVQKNKKKKKKTVQKKEKEKEKEKKLTRPSSRVRAVRERRASKNAHPKPLNIFISLKKRPPRGQAGEFVQ